MRFLFRLLVLLPVALPILAIVALVLCFQDVPTVSRDVRLTVQDIERAKRLLDQHDPRRVRHGGPRTLVIGEQDLDLVANYAASRWGHGAARVAMAPGSMRLQASVEVPLSPIGRFVNVDAVLRAAGGTPEFDRLRIGRLPVPAPVAHWLLHAALLRLAATERGELAADVVQGASIANGRLTVTYVWNDDIERRAREVLLAPAELDRLRAYHDRLVAAAAGAPDRVSVATLLPPLFGAVLERGAAGDLRAESRAALVVLALYATGGKVASIAPSAASWPQPARHTVTLSGRDDFSKHFLVSAALAAAAGTPLADAIGLYKEVDDSRGGSGFSFNDLAADRAGARFGELLTESNEGARRLAQAIVAGVRESDFMPDVADLPEFLPEAEFVRRFGGVDGAGYAKMMAGIEARVRSRPLLR